MKTTPPGYRAAFTRADLLALVASAALLAMLIPTCAATSRGRNEATVCLSNLHRISQAMLQYAGDSRGYVPHCSWGSDLTGPDNWAYATRNNGRLPGGPAAPTSAAGSSDQSRAVTNQHLFQHIGQLWPLIRDDRAFSCPSDKTRTPALYARYLGRPVKITSYLMNPAVAGAGSVGGGLPEGRTYLLDRFLGDSVAFWEGSESNPFYFNDAASPPYEGASARHFKGSHVGRFDGGVEFWKNDLFNRQAGFPRDIVTPSPLPNRLWCNPDSTNGM